MDVAAVEALAATASSAVVTAAATDAFEATRRQVARLFGRGKPDAGVERKLEATRRHLAGAGAEELERAQVRLALEWEVRFKDLIEDHPDAAADLVALVGELRPMTAAGHLAAASRDVSVVADRRGIAAGVVHGDVVSNYQAVPRRVVPRLPVQLPPRPAILAGREDLLSQMRALLTDGARPQTIVLCGLGGVGKTSMAAEYAHRHLAEFGVVWQVTAEDPAILSADLGELAAQLGDSNEPDDRNPVISAHAVLAAYPGQWLLIYDNAVDEASVRRFLPPAGRGQVIITSQNGHWRTGEVLEVPPLTDDVAAGFLANRAANQDETIAAKLAEELGGLPLALEQAAAYVQATGSTLAEYLRLFRRRRADLLARGEVCGHPATVAATLGLASHQVEAESPTAAGLMRLLAYRAAEPVPLAMLLADRQVADVLTGGPAAALEPLLDDALARQDAIAALRRYSLITLAGHGLVSVHRLVQAVILDQTSDDQAVHWRDAAAALIGSAIPSDARASASAARALLRPHAQAVLANNRHRAWRTSESTRTRRSENVMWDLRRVAGDLDRSGAVPNPVWARAVVTEQLKGREQILGAEHPDTLYVRANLATLTGQAGDPRGARDLYAGLLPVLERVVGAEHRQTLLAQASLNWWTQAAEAHTDGQTIL